MTIATTITAPAGRRPSIFARLGALLIEYGEMKSRRDRIMVLSALSDEELSARGLTRDGIVTHVFADKLYL